MSGIALAALAAAGCHSYHVDATVQNRTGKAVQLLEVDYPGGSFGSNSIASGADFSYRFQLRGTGPLKLQYGGTEGLSAQVDGPTLAESQEGRLTIVLLPGGKAEFHPHLSSAR